MNESYKQHSLTNSSASSTNCSAHSFMKTAVIYARYSSDNQTEQSIEGQLRVCEEYAKSNDILILNTYIDRAMTGTNDNRPDFQRMLKDSTKKQWSIILVYKLDRFSRNKYESVIHKKMLKENGVKVVSAMENIPDTPEGIILESLLEGMNQYYSAELAQKIKRGMRETRIKGLYQGGGLLYGYKIENRRIVLNENEYKNVQFMFEQYARGYKVKKIIEILTNKGILNKSKPFKENIVYRILRNEKYTGIYKHDNETIDNMYPPIISKELYAKAQQSIKQNRYGKNSVVVNYLLKGKIKCGYCGMLVSSECSTARNGEVVHYYKCRGRKRLRNGCINKTIRKDELEEIIITKLIEELNKPKNLNKIVNTILEIQNVSAENSDKAKLLMKEKDKREQQLNNVMKAIEQGIINKTTNIRMQELENEIEELEKQIIVEKNNQSLLLTKDDIKNFYIESLKNEPMLLINYLVKEIKLYNDKIEITLNTPLKSQDNNCPGSFLLNTKYFGKEIDIYV